ncbi:hypothetical protein [Nonomuraea sp. KM90]
MPIELPPCPLVFHEVTSMTGKPVRLATVAGLVNQGMSPSPGGD